MVTYLMNTPILTDYGEYSFRRITLQEAIDVMGYGFTSAIGHDGTATLIYQLTGIQVPVNRIAIKMHPSDVAIVFRVLVRLPEGKVLSYEDLKTIPYEFGVLRMIK
jgi:hypothetical protein